MSMKESRFIETQVIAMLEEGEAAAKLKTSAATMGFGKCFRAQRVLILGIIKRCAEFTVPFD